MKQRIAALKQMAWVKDDAAAKQPPELSPALLPKILADRYRIEGLIAEGGHGQVFRAFDEELQRLVAIKIARRRNVPDDDLLEEARRVARLRHPGIVAVHDVGRHEGMFFIVSDLIEGKNLAEVERPSVKEAVRIVADVADALHFAHQQGFIHRDIKPGNILFDADHEPKLIDFGLARRVEAEPESTNVTEGTPYYVAPEKIKREPETFLSDMYSLGATLYHGMTGHVPFDAPTVEEVIVAQVQTPLTPPNLVVPEITQPTSDALVKVMAKNPAERFLSYDEFIMALETARSQLLVMQYQTPHAQKSKSLTSWWKRQ